MREIKKSGMPRYQDTLSIKRYIFDAYHALHILIKYKQNTERVQENIEEYSEENIVSQ